ncbi:MAG: sigma-70 family RNA polymerase sigma factor [Actinomycetota bacterium]
MGTGEAEPRATTLTLEDVYRRERAHLVRLARMMVGSTVIAEEIVHDAFVRLEAAWERVDVPGAYVRTIVVNLCRTWLRRDHRATGALPAAERPVLEPELDETWSVVQRLPEKYRVVLALRFYEDMAEVDIAEVLGCRAGTVRSRVHRGLDLLRKELS